MESPPLLPERKIKLVPNFKACSPALSRGARGSFCYGEVPGGSGLWVPAGGCSHPPHPPNGAILGKAREKCWEKKQKLPGVLSTASERLRRGGGGDGDHPLSIPSLSPIPAQRRKRGGGPSRDLQSGPGRGRRLGARTRAGEEGSSRPWRGRPAPSGSGLVSPRSGMAAVPTAQPDTRGGGGSLIWSSGMKAGGQPRPPASPPPRLR